MLTSSCSSLPHSLPLPLPMFHNLHFSSVQSLSRVLLFLCVCVCVCPTLCDPVNHSTPGLPVHHQLPEFTQTHVYRVGDAIQPSHLLSPSAPNPPQHQGLHNLTSCQIPLVLYFSLEITMNVMIRLSNQTFAEHRLKFSKNNQVIYYVFSSVQ